MENASKALLIAGGVLIAILVASMGVYFARSMADQEARIYARMEDTERTKFNQQFTQFSNKSDNINIQDIITLIHLAKNSNKKNELTNEVPPTDPQNDTSLYVRVNIKNATLSGNLQTILGTNYICEYAEQFTDDILNDILNQEVKENDNLYSCTIEINKNTGYVNYIEIN